MTDKLTLKLNDTVVEIEMDDNGRYCLNNLFKASGATMSKKPNEFFRYKHCDVELINLNSGISHPLPEDFESYALLTGKGRGSKTFAPLKVVYKYAAWVSKDFEDAVYSAFTSLTKGEVKEAANIASSVTITPEIIARYEKLHGKLSSLLKEKYPTNRYVYSNIYRLLGKVATGYTPKELTGGGKTTVEYFISKGHLPAMNAYIASMEMIITLITAGVMDYHVLAAALQVKTSKNGSILEAIM